jgi:hypothetical protein
MTDGMWFLLTAQTPFDYAQGRLRDTKKIFFAVRISVACIR